MSWLMVVGAVLASLALGVLVSYGICQTLFRIFRVHSEAAARERMKAVPVRVVAGS